MKTSNKIVLGLILFVLALAVLTVHKPSRDYVLKSLYKVGLAGEICSNAEVVGDIALPIYKCNYNLKVPLINYCHIGWSGNHCHFTWEEKHIH